ncbi:MAG: hypothetical protein R2851_00390 [Caldilineaceae bacterium]
MDLDAVYVYGDNATGAVLAEAAAEQGLRTSWSKSPWRPRCRRHGNGGRGRA